MNRLQDVLYADSLTQDPSLAVATWKDATSSPPLMSIPSPGDDTEKLSSAADTPTSMTLSDFMGWNFEPPEPDIIRKNKSAGNLGSYIIDEEDKSRANLVM